MIGNRTPPLLCTACGELIDAATCLNDPGVEPQEGSVSICAYFGNAAMFTADRRLRPMTEADLAEFTSEERAYLAYARAVVRAHPPDKRVGPRA